MDFRVTFFAQQLEIRWIVSPALYDFNDVMHFKPDGWM